MPEEIERKYLVDHSKWQAVPKPDGNPFLQCYILADPAKSIRVRITGSACFLTIKGQTNGISRSEYEYEIPREDAEELCANFSVAQIEKVRYKIMYKNKLWEVDVFSGANEGLILAEIELGDINELYEIPGWIAKEVSLDERYFNVNLAQNPYSEDWNTKQNTSGISKDVLKEAADLLLSDMKCYIHRSSFELVSFPDEGLSGEYYMDDEENPWQEDIDKVSGNSDYLELERMESSDSFRVLEDFSNSLPQTGLKNILISALQGRKPFRNFNHLIHNADNERDLWFAYRMERMIEWVSAQTELL